ncbi:MAG: trypsin-like serine protease [Myxococcota bacterium]|nr:trypsin-like serine protease [Myxococcota bacterium]
MRLRALAPALCLLWAAPMPGCVSPPEPAVRSGLIWNGTPTEDHPAVGALTVNGAAFCTGTLVAPDAVLTAAHCIDYLDGVRGEELTFVTGPGDSGPLEGGVPIDESLNHPDWDGWTADIGLVLLAEPASEVPLWAHLDEMDEGEWTGRMVTLVGYGITADGLTDSGEKLETDVEIYAFDEDVFFHYTAGTNACFGDSGGPALYEFEDRWRVVGVLSAVFPYLQDDQSCVGGGGYQIRVDHYADWIAEQVEINTEPGDDDDDDADDDDDEGLDDGGGGCQCRAAGRRASSGVLALLVLAGARRRG